MPANQIEWMGEKRKTGFLHEDFRLFYLNNKESNDFDFHYHDFHKIIIPIRGEVSYLMEGKTYLLRPWDILLVNRFHVHKPIIAKETDYERIVIWIKNSFIETQNSSEDSLSRCFFKAQELGYHLVSLDINSQEKISQLITQIEINLTSSSYGSSLMARTYFQQLLVYINRIFIENKVFQEKEAFPYNAQIEAILRFINQHLNQDLSAQKLSEEFYLSRYYLMHKFKKETGVTLHQYVEQKRLVYAANAMQKGDAITKAAADAGFHDYSTFLRAFRRKYEISPTQFIKKNSLQT